MISSIDFQNQVENRYLSIDFLKGTIIILMVFVNTLSYFDTTPFWTRHADVYGLTYVDLIAPCFIFLLTINFHLSYEKRVKTMDTLKLYRHYLIRNLILLGLGLFLYLDISKSGISLRWGTLQVIASTGIIILFFVKIPAIGRLLIGLVSIFFYQTILLPNFSTLIYESIEGGIISIVSWGSIGLISSFLATGLIKHKEKIYFLYIGLVFLMTGFILSPYWGISRFLLTMPFNLISVGISSVLFYIIFFIFEKWEKKENISFLNQDNFISLLGKNSLILFLIHLILINFIFVIVPEDLSVWFTFPIAKKPNYRSSGNGYRKSKPN
jgi:predicted acyltransferase